MEPLPRLTLDGRNKKKKQNKKWVLIEIMLRTAMSMMMIRRRRRSVLTAIMTIADVARCVLRNQNFNLELSSFSAFVICLSAILSANQCFLTDKSR